MPTDFEDLTDAHRRTSQALQQLILQLRRTSLSPGVRSSPQVVAASGERREPLAIPSPGRSQGAQRETFQAGLPARNRAELPTGDQAVAGVIRRGEESVADALNETTKAVRELGPLLTRNTRALSQSVAALAAGQGLVTNLLASLGRGGGGGGLLRSGFGLLPLGLKIAGLFRDRGDERISFTPFELPPSLSLEVANTDNLLAGFPRVGRKQDGQVKLIPPLTTVVQPQVQVNVNALDTQSFLDRSQEIAGALRDAMLHMHPINDVVGEV